MEPTGEASIVRYSEEFHDSIQRFKDWEVQLDRLIEGAGAVGPYTAYLAESSNSEAAPMEEF